MSESTKTVFVVGLGPGGGRRVAKNGVQHEASQHSPGGHHTPASASFVYCTVFTRRSWRFSAQSAASST